MIQLRGPGAFDDPKIADDLKLSTDQRQRIRELEFGNMRSLFGFGRSGRGPGPRGESGRGPGSKGEPGRGPGSKGEPALRQLYRRNGVESILQVLTPEQNEKWKQMTGRLVEFKPPDRPQPPR